MRILGIDPGFAIVGYGVLEYDNITFRTLGYGAITTQAGEPYEDRLQSIYQDIDFIIKKYKPTVMAVEKLFFFSNQKTVIDVAGARGVILLAGRQNDLDIFQYTPLQVKQGVAGYGKAEKRQVQEMIKNILKLKTVPKPDDTADALAIAICHGNTNHSLRTIYENRGKK